MNAVVLKTEGNRAAVLDGDGSVRIIENLNYSRGQVLNVESLILPFDDGETPIYEYEVRTGRKSTVTPIGHFIYRKVSKAAAAAAVIVLAGSLSVYAAPVKTVTTDSTPSLEYKLNVFDRVVRVEVLDEADEDLPKELTHKVVGKKFDKAVDIALDTLEKTLPYTEIKQEEKESAERSIEPRKDEVKDSQNDILEDEKQAEDLKNDESEFLKNNDIGGTDKADNLDGNEKFFDTENKDSVINNPSDIGTDMPKNNNPAEESSQVNSPENIGVSGFGNDQMQSEQVVPSDPEFLQEKNNMNAEPPSEYRTGGEGGSSQPPSDEGAFSEPESHGGDPDNKGDGADMRNDMRDDGGGEPASPDGGRR